MIESSSKRKKIGPISITKSLFKEGRIMSKADKKSTLRELSHFNDYLALVSGSNKRLK